MMTNATMPRNHPRNLQVGGSTVLSQYCTALQLSSGRPSAEAMHVSAPNASLTLLFKLSTASLAFSWTVPPRTPTL